MTGTRSEKRLIGYARVAYAMLNLSRFAARVPPAKSAGIFPDAPLALLRAITQQFPGQIGIAVTHFAFVPTSAAVLAFAIAVNFAGLSRQFAVRTGRISLFPNTTLFDHERGRLPLLLCTTRTGTAVRADGRAFDLIVR